MPPATVRPHSVRIHRRRIFRLVFMRNSTIIQFRAGRVHQAQSRTVEYHPRGPDLLQTALTAWADRPIITIIGIRPLMWNMLETQEYIDFRRQRLWKGGTFSCICTVLYSRQWVRYEMTWSPWLLTMYAVGFGSCDSFDDTNGNEEYSSR